MKTCTQCGIEKPLDEFHIWGKHRNGHRPQCKACRCINRQKRFQPLSRSKEEYSRLHDLQLKETPETKVCVKCNAIKPLKEFSPNKTYRKNVFSRCLTCEQVRGVDRYSSTDRRKRTIKNYGLSPKEYEALLDSQGGLCMICDSSKGREGVGLYVDHDHSTGLIRGLLCGNCNTGIGMLGDDPERLETAAAYLRKNHG